MMPSAGKMVQREARETAAGQAGYYGTVTPETEALVDANRALVVLSDRQDDVLDTLPYEIAYYGWQCVSYWVNV